MRESPQSGAAVFIAAGLILFATMAFRCPGNEPSAASDDEGGEPAEGGAGGTGGAPQGAGPEGGEGGEGGSGGAECDPNMVMDDIDNCGECGHPCGTQGVEMPLCQMGLCRPTCASGNIDFGFPSSGDDDGCETPGRRVFITAGTYSADLDGVDGADDACQAAAEAVGLLGNWQAWISQFQNGVSDRFVESDVPYLLLDGSVVADNWMDLTDGQIQRAIDLDEHMVIAPKPRTVWTATQFSGAPLDGSDCNGWTDDTEGSASVGTSFAKITSGNWSVGGERQCTAPDVHLYCFEK